MELPVSKPKKSLAALPNASKYIPIPQPSPLNEWQIPQEELNPMRKEIENTLMKCCSNEATTRPKNLFICDSLLKGVSIRSTIECSERINLYFLRSFFPFFEGLDKIRDEKRNKYNIANIFIACGMDSVVRAKIKEDWLKEIKEFIKKLFDFINRDFGQEPQGSENSDPNDAASRYPCITFITIPCCKGGPAEVRTYNGRLKKVNQYFRDYVSENSEKYRGRLNIVDWQKGIDELAETDILKDIKKVSKTTRDMRFKILCNMLENQCGLKLRGLRFHTESSSRL